MFLVRACPCKVHVERVRLDKETRAAIVAPR
jgi:hypothetical protein